MRNVRSTLRVGDVVFRHSLFAVRISLFAFATAAFAQGSATLGNGLSAAAMARGGIDVIGRDSALDAMEGNPAGLGSASHPSLEFGALGLAVGGSFHDAYNSDSKPRGLAGAVPFGAFVTPIRSGPWRVSAAFTPEILVRANWHYIDPPGTAAVSYGYQTQEDEIIAVRSAVAGARSFGPHWSAGATLGVVYNHNDLHAPYIFQQQPQLQGLKVLLGLTTHGYGWNGGAGVQWTPSSRLAAGLAWKSGTTIHTTGEATGTASALFAALGINADPTFRYHATVQNHLPQAFDAGLSWRAPRHVTLAFETDFTAWEQAFQQLPVSLSGGTNATINSVAGSSSIQDAVPLHWNNQFTYHAGAELPVSESWALRAGFSHATQPVPASTLIPLTAAIMQNAIGTGAGYTHGHWHYDAAYQAQLPATQSVVKSGLQAGEYDNSSIRVFTQSLTVTSRVIF